MEQSGWLLIAAVTGFTIFAIVLQPAEAAGKSKKRILIHVPVQVKHHHHTHTVYKHIVHEHDHEHQHHNEPTISSHAGEPLETLSGEYVSSGSHADYKVLGYTYGDDAEPPVRIVDDSAERVGARGQSSAVSSSEEVDQYRDRPSRWRRPTSAAEKRPYRDRHHGDDDDDDIESSSGRGSSQRGHSGGRGRPNSSHGSHYRGYRSGSKGGRDREKHQHGYSGEYKDGSQEDVRSDEDEHSDEIWG